MTLLQVVSIMAPVFSLAAKGGIAHQAVKNFRRKSTDGISIPFFILGILSYGFLTLLGILLHSASVALASAPGVLLNLVIVEQARRYKDNRIETGTSYERIGEVS